MSSSSSRAVASGLIAVAFVPFLAFGVVGNAAGIDSALGLAAVIIGPVISVGVAWQILRWQGTGWTEVGLAAPKSWLRTAVYALGALVGALFVIVLVQNVGAGLGAEPIDETRFDSLEGSIPFLVVSLLGAWTTISFGEEMLFRAFFISRVMELIASPRFGATVAVISGGVVFGVTHFAEGSVGIVSNGAFGVLFGAIYVRTGRNLWVTIIAHGLLNTLRFILVFAGATG